MYIIFVICSTCQLSMYNWQIGRDNPKPKANSILLAAKDFMVLPTVTPMPFFPKTTAQQVREVLFVLAVKMNK